ncbi:hypothetical protein DYB25_013907, partial [Aphanomyces astaci]
MGRGLQLDEYQRGQISVWKASGKSVLFMSKSLGKSCKAIANYLKDPQAYGKRFKGGRPPKLSDTTLRLMFREVSKTGLSSSKIDAQLDLPITSRAVRYQLSSNTIF